MKTDQADKLTGKDLRAVIAEEILGWKRAKIGPDAKGENAGEVLTIDGLPAGSGFQYPPLGPVHLCYHTPRYDGPHGYEVALRLARIVGLELTVSQLPADGEELAWLCLAHWRAKHQAAAPAA